MSKISILQISDLHKPEGLSYETLLDSKTTSMGIEYMSIFQRNNEPFEGDMTLDKKVNKNCNFSERNNTCDYGI